MPFNGQGQFNVTIQFVPGSDALAEDVNDVIAQLAAGLSACLTRDGQAAMTGALDMGGNRLRQLPAATDDTDPVTLGQAKGGFPLPSVKITGASGTKRSLFFQTDGSNRFELQTTTTPESGTGSGSNLGLYAFQNDGTTSKTVLTVNRNSGAIDFGFLPTFGGGQSIIPPGLVAPFAMLTPPAGWLVADGSVKSRTTYAALYAAIGDTYGAGNGSTTFSLPDIRGIFVRGFDDNHGLDPGRAFASYQEDAMQNHTHGYRQSGKNNFDLPQGANSGNTVNGGDLGSNTGAPSGRADIETRPKNIAFQYCIKT